MITYFYFQTLKFRAFFENGSLYRWGKGGYVSNLHCMYCVVRKQNQILWLIKESCSWRVLVVLVETIHNITPQEWFVCTNSLTIPTVMQGSPYGQFDLLPRMIIIGVQYSLFATSSQPIKKRLIQNIFNILRYPSERALSVKLNLPENKFV